MVSPPTCFTPTPTARAVHFRTVAALSSGQGAPKGNEFCPRKHLKVSFKSHPAPHCVTLMNPCHAGDPGSIAGWGRSPGEGNGFPLQYSCLENPMDGGAWLAIDHGVAESDTTERLTPTPWASAFFVSAKRSPGGNEVPGPSAGSERRRVSPWAPRTVPAALPGPAGLGGVHAHTAVRPDPSSLRGCCGHQGRGRSGVFCAWRTLGSSSHVVEEGAAAVENLFGGVWECRVLPSVKVKFGILHNG